MSESQPMEIDYRALNLRDEQRVMYLTDLWNPFFLTNADHIKMMDQQYGNSGDDLEIEQPKT